MLLTRCWRRNAFAVALGLTLLGCVRTSAQISLSTAVDLALRNSPKVRVSQAAATKARFVLDQAYDVYTPSVTADAGYGKGLGVPTGLPTVFTLSGESLVFNFSQRDNIRAAAAGLEAAKLALHDIQDQVAEDVAVTYLNLDNDRKRQEAIVQEAGFAKRLVRIVQDRLNAGDDTSITLLEARRTAKQLELNQLQLQDEIDGLCDHLSRLIGVPGGDLKTVSISIPALPSADAISAGRMTGDSFGVRAAQAVAKSKQELAFGMERYLLRPQIALGLNYSRIDTGEDDYTQYYPNFIGKSSNAESFYFSVQLPLYDRRHLDQTHEAEAEAVRARYDAEDQRNQFLEGRSKLQRNVAELADQCALAELDRDLSQEQLNATLAQLSSNAGLNGRPQLSPKDEQNARIEEGRRDVDLLEMEFHLDQAKLNLLQQTGQLGEWLKTSPRSLPDNVIPSVIP